MKIDMADDDKLTLSATLDEDEIKVLWKFLQKFSRDDLLQKDLNDTEISIIHQMLHAMR